MSNSEKIDGEFDVLMINPNASKLDLIDMISQRMSQLPLDDTWLEIPSDRAEP